MSFFGNSLEVLYLIPLIQIIVFVFLIDQILKPANLAIRLCAITSAFWLAGIVPLSNLIIPERNALLLLLIGIFCIKRYKDSPNIYIAATGVFAFTCSLYYKEPVFALLLVFIFVSLLYNAKNIFQRLTTEKKKVNVLKYIGAIETGTFFASLSFIVGYLFYTYYKGGPESYYLGTDGKPICSSIFRKILLLFNRYTYFIYTFFNGSELTLFYTKKEL